jgi:hypothetical protein
MNCDAACRRLLAAERPDRPAADVRRHLAACPACRAWARRLAEAEAGLARLPVPPPAPAALEALLRRVHEEPAPAGTNGLPPLVRPGPLTPPTPAKERALRKLAWAVAIAATLLVFALASWAWHARGPQKPPAPAPWQDLVDQQARRDHILAEGTPRERVEKLAELAGDVQKRVRTLAKEGDAEHLAQEAAFYGELVRDNLPGSAAALPADERPAVLQPVADGLDRANSDFAQMAAAAAGPASASLHDLERAARDGGVRLRELLHA